jgi:predicted ATPase
VFAAAVHQTLRDPAAVSEHAAKARRLAEDHGFGLMRAWAEILGGAGLVALGDPKGGIAGIKEGITATRDVGSAQFLPHYLALQADAELRLGRVDQGLETIAEALDLVAATGERFNEAELYRLQGELFAAGGCDWTEVDAAYLHAIDIAQQQGARLLALRSGVSRARSSVGNADHAKAMKLVSYWYGQLGDAASMPDLVEARTFLA